MKDLAIGVFDSGMGGISLLKELQKLMPNEKYIYYGDSKNVPYGTKNIEELKILSSNICDYFIKRGVKAIVIACNTATSAAADFLRNKYDIPIIGIEPALKPAIEKYSFGKIAVLATEVTLREKKFNTLLSKYEHVTEVIKIPAPNLVNIVESGITNGCIAEQNIMSLFENIDKTSLSCVVLGCTHFIFLKKSIQNVLGSNIAIIDGNFGTSNHLKNILLDRNLISSNSKGSVEIINSSQDKSKIELSKKLFEL